MNRTKLKTSMGKLVKEELVNWIITGKLKSGDVLKEQDIAEQLGVGRTSVRDAMLILEEQGLITRDHYKSAIVLGVDAKEVGDLLVPLRITMECYALTRFLEIGTDEDFRYMDNIVRKMEFGAYNKDLSWVVNADLEFHEYMLHASKLQSVSAIWSSIYNRMHVYFYTSTEQLLDELDKVALGHEELLKVMKTRNVSRAKQMLIRHIQEVLESD